MPQFDQEFIEKVRTAVDIVEIIGQDVKLTQRGRNFVGLCPFHDEKTPSFTVSPSNQLYYCFGCGSGGNVYTYLVNSRNMTFPEAVAALAQHAGVELPKLPPQQSERRQKIQQIYELNRLAAVYYYRMLRSKEGQEARSYLVQRGLTKSLPNSSTSGMPRTAGMAWSATLRKTRNCRLNWRKKRGSLFLARMGITTAFATESFSDLQPQQEVCRIRRQNHWSGRAEIPEHTGNLGFSQRQKPVRFELVEGQHQAEELCGPC